MNNEKYMDIPDEELIVRLRDGEREITEFIMDKYKNLVKNKAKAMFILGADTEDLIQEGMIGLFKALRDYDLGRDASFHTFADLCISRQIYTAVQASNRKKHMPLNTYISLYSNIAESEGEEAYLVEALQSAADKSPEELMIDKENVAGLEKAIEQALSPFEKQVLDLYVTGMSYVQIARILDRDEKSTDNALQRIKAKIRRVTE
ncbi:MAG TPA: RNA polymerase sporulation sigma factor SigH [Lachnospiraceae bacterium]|nr:RNA polymerase sporulation sigma factor SigH [Lachnospiraceae bacterium]